MCYAIAKILTLFVFLLQIASSQTLQEKRWASATVSPLKEAQVGRIVDRILRDKQRYVFVDSKTRVPWYVIAGLHNMESSGSFKAHLHEGSPLTGRTRWVPKGRPVKGKPPFTWEESAIDALEYDKMPQVRWAYLDDTLYACEKYNGLGYLKYHPETPTQYLWSGTSIERPGKYIADSKWSSTARSNQIGIAAIWKVMEKRGILNFKLLR